jgi:hypothetical protein
VVKLKGENHLDDIYESETQDKSNLKYHIIVSWDLNQGRLFPQNVDKKQLSGYMNVVCNDGKQILTPNINFRVRIWIARIEPVDAIAHGDAGPRMLCLFIHDDVFIWLLFRLRGTDEC